VVYGRIFSIQDRFHDLFEPETSIFWKGPGVDPKSIKTEVFLLPACSSIEKEGSITGSGRWAQWRYAAIHPVGESRSDLRIVDELCKALKNEYAKGGTFPEPILDLAWGYGSGEEPDPHAVAKEMNGRFLADVDFPDKKKSFKKGQQAPSFAFLKDDGHAQLFAGSLKDGPFPEHYEPLESPIKNPMSSVQFSPAIKVFEPDKIGTSEEYPIIATTFRMAEHWQAGAMKRNVPWLVELVPDVFIQIGRELAERLEPFSADGKIVDQIAIPWHFGYAGLATGDGANMLTAHVGDANTTIPEYKVFLCNVTKKEVA
jgi:anaerobic selenocysteine-containing dehydrogenase